jgi:hypothetical protein
MEYSPPGLTEYEARRYDSGSRERLMGLNFGIKAMVGLLFGVAISAGFFVLTRRAWPKAGFRPPPRDGSKLFALRFMLMSAFVGLSVAWLTTRPAYSWPIWGLLAYFGAVGTIGYLVLGVRNSRWIWSVRSMSIRGILAEHVLCLLCAVGAGVVVAAFARGDRPVWRICGLSLAAVAACSWAAVRWADPEGG